MTGTTHMIRLGVVLSLVFVAAQAPAWGPRAQRAISGMSIQVIQHKYPETFRPGEANYEQDVLRGAEAGAAVIARTLPINSEEEAIQAIGIEIQLLKDIRPTGAGSYFAFRMGALSALISDVLLPYGLVWTPEHMALQKKIENDINRHLSDYGFINPSTVRTPIIDVNRHFRAQKAFYGDNRTLIADDYRRGIGYAGLLKESTGSYFSKAVESSADAWYTIIMPRKGSAKPISTNTLMEQYYVDEIGYLLSEKKNFHQAGVVYENLASMAPDRAGVFEEVGDHYHAFGTQNGVERGVKEWRNAHDLGGTGRARIAGKLSAHFLKEGREYLDEAEEKGKGETELPSALSSFQQALRFDRTSDVAAELIQETNRRKKERDEHLSMIVKIIATAESTREEAENQATGGNFGNAILSFGKASEILTAVDDEFTDQSKLAEKMKGDIDRAIGTAIADIQELASGAIEEGEQLEETHKYDEAIKSYERVAVIVQDIPDAHNRNTTQEKQDIMAVADSKVEKAKSSKLAHEQQMKTNPGGAARPPAARPAAAPRAAPAAPAAAPAAPTGRRGRGDRE